MTPNLLNTFNDKKELVSSKIIPWPNDPEGYSPLECFVYFDSNGKELPCNDLQKFKEIQNGKENVNLQIKMWVETTFDMPIVLMPSEVKEITKEYRSWVFESYVNQLKRLYMNKQGFIPTFLREFIAL